MRSCKIRLFQRQNRGIVIRDTRRHEISILLWCLKCWSAGVMLGFHWHQVWFVSLPPGGHYTWWKVPFTLEFFKKLPQKCNFNCYLCQRFHWLGPALVSCGGQMWSSTDLTMRWFQSLDTFRFTCSQTQQCQFCAVDEGALPPTTPVNPYLGGSAWKKWSFFYFLGTITVHLKLHFYTKMTFRGHPESPKVQGGKILLGGWTNPLGIERVK